MEGQWGRQHYTPWWKGEKIRILFLFQAASVWASWESFYQACLEDRDIEVKLLLTESSVEKAQMRSAEYFLREKRIPYQELKAFDIDGYRPHIACIQFPYDLAYHVPQALSLRLKEKGVRVVYIPYGIEISDEINARRDHFENFVVENSWRIFTCCEAIKGEYWKYCRNREAVRVCGSPKFDGIARRGKYPLAAGIAEQSRGKKIILWKIHFPKKITVCGETVQITPDLEEYIKFAEELEQYGNLFFVVMVHPKMLYGMVSSDTKGDSSLQGKADRLLGMIRRQKNVYLDTADDYRNSLYHADAIMMDRSAVMIEAAMTGKPVLLMNHSIYKEHWTAGVKQVAETFVQGSTAADMESFVKAVGRGELAGQGKTKAALETYFPYRDGKCGHRIKELVKKELAEEAEEERAGRKFRIVLYGAGDVCRYYLEELHFAESELFRVEVIADGNEKRWGESFCGFPIVSPETLKAISYDAVVIMSEQNYYEIKKKLVYELYLDERKIRRLDEFVDNKEG